MNIKKIIRKIDKYEYVSFDIFDTIIKRNISKPTDLFQIAFNLSYFENEDIRQKFIKDRIQCEKELWNKDNKNFTFNSIYDLLLKKYSYEKKLLDKLKNEELKWEVELCEKNYAFIDVFNYCINNNKKVVFISDMYLSKKYIEKILNKNDILKYYKLFVSSEYKALKANGNLYKEVLKELKVNSKKIIHIGDNFKGDYLNARKNKIKSIKIPTIISNLKFKYDENSNEDINYLYHLMNNSINKYENEYERMGYEYLGNLLLGLVLWIHDEKIRTNSKSILFLSRDGYIVKKAYDMIFPNENNKYFYISRRSITVPLLSDIDTTGKIKEIIKYRKNERILNYLKRCGIDIDNPNDELLSCDEKKLDKYLKQYFEEIKENAKKEKDSFFDYLNELKIENNVLIFDIGWHGSTQNALKKILKNKYVINGAYLSLVDGETPEKKAFIVSKKYPFENYSVASFRGILETFFTANHSSVKCYSKNGVKFFEENYQVDLTIETIQKGALLFIKDYSCGNYRIDKCPIDHEFFVKSTYRLLTKPNLKQIKLFSEIKFFDMEDRYLISKVPIIKFKKFYREFIESDWKIGFLKYNLKIFNFYDRFVKFIYLKFNK